VLNRSSSLGRVPVGVELHLNVAKVKLRGEPLRLTSSCCPRYEVACLRVRKQREECEGFPATQAATATDPNPIVMFVVRLLPAPSEADDRIAFTSRASPQDHLVAVSGPVRFDLVHRSRKRDKENRSSLGLRRRG
jgi:hypothetical protein